MKLTKRSKLANEDERQATEILVRFAETIGLGHTNIIKKFRRKLSRR